MDSLCVCALQRRPGHWKHFAPDNRQAGALEDLDGIIEALNRKIWSGAGCYVELMPTHVHRPPRVVSQVTTSLHPPRVDHID